MVEEGGVVGETILLIFEALEGLTGRVDPLDGWRLRQISARKGEGFKLGLSCDFGAPIKSACLMAGSQGGGEWS